MDKNLFFANLLHFTNYELMCDGGKSIKKV